MSEIILDTITGKSTATTITIGSTPVVSASANSMTIRGEGSNQTSIQQGLAKAWLQATDSAALSDSLNIASSTDDGTGTYSYTLTNSMGNNQWSMTTNAMAGEISQIRNVTLLTNIIRNHVYTRADSFTAADQRHTITLHGDLA
jgi:hypothetical protein